MTAEILYSPNIVTAKIKLPQHKHKKLIQKWDWKERTEIEKEIDLKMAVFASIESPGTDGDEPN